MSNSIGAMLFVILPALFVGNVCVAGPEDDGPNLSSQALIDFKEPDASKQVVAIAGNPTGSAVTVDSSGIKVSISSQRGSVDHAGLRVFPPAGKTFWDLAAFGHVVARITNLSPDKAFDVVMHVVDDADDYWRERKTEFVNFKPGETRPIKVVFGYQYGFKPGPPVNAAKIKEIYFFVWGGKTIERSFRIESIRAGGTIGEMPMAEQQPSQSTAKP